MLSRLTILLLLSITLSCSNKELIKPGEPINSAYEKSITFYEKEEYSDAAYGFDLVTRMGRGTSYAKEAQFLLAESYFKNNFPNELFLGTESFKTGPNGLAFLTT